MGAGGAVDLVDEAQEFAGRDANAGFLLGFAAGVLNVMRSAGIVRTTPDGRSDFSSLPGNEKNGNGK